MNGKEVWYIGSSLNHYHCLKCYISTKRSEGNADTVVFFPKQINFPAVKMDAFITQSEEEIIAILANPPEPTVPSIEAGDKTNYDLLKLALIFD